MAQALRLARRGLYTTDPNPRVGCVVVRQGRIVGQGWHQQAGAPHAEVHALAEAGEEARGATIYVTLEPCSHHGRTPPCADALVAAGVARVVAAMEDPNPEVSGRGMARLRAAGIEVAVGLLSEQAEALNPGFVSRMRRQLPHVRCKLAMSLDGRTAMASGESKWITSAAARADVQRLRARSSAIVTGIGTVLADDPRLDVRLDEPVKQPLRVVLDRRARFPARARMLATGGEVLVATAAGMGPALPERVVALELAERGRGLDLHGLMRRLARRQINEVLVESGPTLAGAMLEAGLIDELVIYMAPHLMGDDARGLFHLPGLSRMEQRIDLDIIDLRQVGPDLRLTARPRLREK